jgi:hypothetical protein
VWGVAVRNTRQTRQNPAITSQKIAWDRGLDLSKGVPDALVNVRAGGDIAQVLVGLGVPRDLSLAFECVRFC